MILLSDPALLLSLLMIGMGFRVFNQFPRSQLEEYDKKYRALYGEYYAMIIIGIPTGLLFFLNPPFALLMFSVYLSIWVNRSMGHTMQSPFEGNQKWQQKQQHLDTKVS